MFRLRREQLGNFASYWIASFLDQNVVPSSSGSNWLKEEVGLKQMSEQTIVLGDALEKLKDFQSESFDLIIADPPYNLGKDYGNNHDIKGFDEYLSFSRKWTKECHRILKSTGTLYVFMGFRFITYLYDILDRDLGMFFNSW